MPILRGASRLKSVISHTLVLSHLKYDVSLKKAITAYMHESKHHLQWSVKLDNPKDKFVTMIMSNTKIIPSSIWRVPLPSSRLANLRGADMAASNYKRQEQIIDCSIGDQMSSRMVF